MVTDIYNIRIQLLQHMQHPNLFFNIYLKYLRRTFKAKTLDIQLQLTLSAKPKPSIRTGRARHSRIQLCGRGGEEGFITCVSFFYINYSGRK